jgi:hypothetical protein
MIEKSQMKTIRSCTMILLLFSALSIASVSALTSFSFGGKSGDWTEYALQDSLGLTGEYVRMEFLNVAGTDVTVNATIYTASLTESNKTTTIDLASQESQDDFTMDPWFNGRVYFIPGGLGTNDTVYLGQRFGFVTIVGETTVSYAGANRRVIYANFTSQGNNYVFYWDKQTGVLAEGAETFGVGFIDVLVSGTSMWSADFLWWLWIIVAIAIALGVLSSRKSVMKKLHRKSDAQASQSKVALFPLLPKGKVNRNVRVYLAGLTVTFISDWNVERAMDHGFKRFPVSMCKNIKTRR